MNNTLDIKRFGKVLRRDGLNFFPNLILTLAILWAIPVVIYLSTCLMPTFGTYHVYDAMSRISVIEALTNIALIIAPARLYRYCNDSRKGIGYAMMPASTLEKFLSMVIYCVIVTPIIYIAGALAIDSILALFNGPYEGYAMSIYFDRAAQFNIVADRNGVYFGDTLPDFMNTVSPAFMTISGLLSILMLSSIFMFGNMIFKKHKTGKMIGILIVISIVLMIVFAHYLVKHATILTNMDEDAATELVGRLIVIVMNVMLYIEIIISAVMLWGTYRKIKTQKY